ncbi:hypothetical protein GCM10010406_52820 [Streptomyces thermolineatus]|uniref:XRE family transcriptional regulator n=1 Tax=Streptomyces thermolineatus TaxID=44033 RepID=A0ABN3MVW7_9ACTN
MNDDLSRLVRERRAELRYSLRAVSDRMIGPDGAPVRKHSWVESLEKNKLVIPPAYDDVAAIAQALDLPLRQVQDAAAAQFLRIKPSAPCPEFRRFMAAWEHLTDDDKQRIQDIIKVFSARRAATSAGE